MATPQNKELVYNDVLNYLYNSTPLYQQQKRRDIKKMGLEKIAALCKELGYPERRFKAVHIAGTNGKGSTSHALASILQAAGYKTGLYTSPHVTDFRERIRLNGKVISKSYVIDFVHKHKKCFEQIRVSFFEMTVALAFSFFAANKADIAVIEVGLGGRLDATNVLLPEVSIITNISFDHTAILGDTLSKIAYEKAGIIKPYTPVVIGEYHEETATVFEQVATAQKAPLVYAVATYQVDLLAHTQKQLVVEIKKEGKCWLSELIFDGGGLYQCKNIPGILSGVDILTKRGFIIDEQALRLGLSTLKGSTGLLGRWQILSSHPRIIADAAHNRAGIHQVVYQLNQLSYNQLHLIFGMGRKPVKEAMAMLRLLPEQATYYFVQAQAPGSMEIEELKKLASEAGLRGAMYCSAREALEQAKKHVTDPEDMIIITGSIYIIAEVLANK